MQPYQETGLNVCDLRIPCVSEGLCYEENDWIEEFLNLDSVKDAVGSEVDTFVGCDSTVGYQFFLTGDHSKPFQQDVAIFGFRSTSIDLRERQRVHLQLAGKQSLDQCVGVFEDRKVSSCTN